MSQTTDDNFNDRQSEIGEIVGTVSTCLDELGCAEDCEKPSDFDVNVDEAIDSLETALKDLKAVRA